ncbi:hypothetical protein [Bifidobacterium sp. ESL0745]|uniref:hypothetical protein n=1 Tax=Bifidobacterium sp. ESL0745 TaxID=2983226 RepID=UPI0023F61973|nr:hypothetical protein [Bifidobacterium sp. ESL0745]MDF7665167.1 hypothetical protein [Bifidobacterium sp. ESL0745]
MEIGSVADWATAVAETAAVIVALFLPYIDRRKKDRKDSRNIKLMLRGLVTRALQDDNPNSLESFLNVAAFTDAGERDKETLATARQILELFNIDNTDIEQRNNEIRALLETIHP